MALVLAASGALPSLSYPLGRDQSTYGVIGQGLLHGAKLYRDLWDMKPPGIFWIYALIVKVFGPVMWSVGVVDILWLLAISICIFRFAERYAGTAAAVVAVLVNAAWHLRGGYVNAAQPETFLALFVFAAYFLVWREDVRWPLARHFAAGLVFGGAFWMKYNAVAIMPFFALAPYLDPGGLDARPIRLRLSIPWAAWLKRVTALLAGFAAAIAGVFSYFWLTGLWTTLWESHFRAVSLYGSSPLHYRPDYWLVPIASTIAYLGVLTVMTPVAAFLVARKTKEAARVAPMCLGAALAYGSVLIQLRFAQYAFENCYPFFAMAWGYLAVKSFTGLRSLDRDFSARGERLARLGIWIVLAAALVFWPLRVEARSLAERYRWLSEWRANPDRFYANYPAQHKLEHLNGQMQVVQYLEENSALGDDVYVWGAHPLIYYLTGVRPPTRFVPNIPLMAVWGPAAWREELLQDLKRSPPTFIVVARNDEIFPITFTHLDSEHYLSVFPGLASLIGGSYRRVVDLPDFVIYRRTAVP